MSLILAAKRELSVAVQPKYLIAEDAVSRCNISLRHTSETKKRSDEHMNSSVAAPLCNCQML
jgi:hypothetical protein